MGPQESIGVRREPHHEQATILGARRTGYQFSPVHTELVEVRRRPFVWFESLTTNESPYQSSTFQRHSGNATNLPRIPSFVRRGLYRERR